MADRLYVLWWFLRHPYRAAGQAVWERKMHQRMVANGWRRLGAERDAQRVLEVLVRDGGQLLTVHDITEVLRGTMTRTRVNDALLLLVGDGDAFKHQEHFSGMYVYGATEFDETERNRREAARRVSYER